MEKKFGFIGGGRISQIFLTGFKKAGISLDNTIISDRNIEALAALKNEFPGINIVNDNKIAASQDIVFISLYPPVMVKVLDEIRSSLKSNSTVISFTPKIKLDTISEILGDFQNVVRMMPKVSPIINEEYPLVFSSKMNEIHKKEILDILQVLGNCHEIDENKFETYASITSIGSTYFWFQLDTNYKKLENY